MDSSDRGRGLGWHGSALVAVDGQRSALTVSLVLQEMGLAVDVAADGGAALRWVSRARYAVAVCGGAPQTGSTELVELAIGLRHAAPQTRVILLAGAGTTPERLDVAGVEVLPSPFDVNRLVELLWPAAV